MSNVALTSEEKSPFVSAITAKDKVALPTYKIPYSTGVSLPLFNRMPCDSSFSASTALNGQIVRTKVEVHSDWKLGAIRYNFRFGGTLGAGTNFGPIGLTMCDNVIGTQSTTLRTQQAEAVLCEVNKLPFAQKSAVIQRALIHSAATGAVVSAPVVGVDYYCYCPVLLSSFESIRNHWALDKLEPIQITSTFNDFKEIGLIATATIVASSVSNPVEVFSIGVERSAEDKLAMYEANFGSGLDMPYLSYDSSVQITDVVGTGASQTVKVKLATTENCFAQSSYVRPKIPLANKAGISVGAFTGLSIKFNNKSYMENIPPEMSSLITDMSGSATDLTVNEAGSVVLSNYPIHTLGWNEKPMDKTSFSGCISYGSINLPEFTYTFAGSAVDYEIITVSHFHTEQLMNGKSGLIKLG